VYLMPDGLTFTFHGVRGSVAIDRPDATRYGGSTICISARVGEGHYLVLDAGTGLRDLQHRLPSGEALSFTFLMTHFHWDHLIGLPFFQPLYHPENAFTFYATPAEGGTVEQGIGAVMEPPLFPVPLRDAPSHRSFREVPGEPFQVEGLTIRTARLRHPQGVTSYRIERNGRSLVLATDIEAGDPASDAALRELAHGADLLIHDGQYLPEEMVDHRGWGHSTWEQATAVAEQAGVDRLILISHDPERTDEGVDALLAAARERFANTDAAYAGMQMRL
jgi:phosphoribosyl 1,2-cyclic phosphodiesterase